LHICNVLSSVVGWITTLARPGVALLLDKIALWIDLTRGNTRKSKDDPQLKHRLILLFADCDEAARRVTVNPLGNSSSGFGEIAEVVLPDAFLL
jgi:predicted RNA-binding protein with PUA domain